jgi:hypothetical protein
MLANIKKVAVPATPAQRRMLLVASALIFQRYRQNWGPASRADKGQVVSVRVRGNFVPFRIHHQEIRNLHG